eukprot:CAMPEP_0198282456 /NCGR_PEP_ID=MMETSP1449-20131203/2275_1 /TAXON_ID=420275 /ORGANISM="Attheya septentrionalis, Strain CCMP2084" /LENGTH=236 /DNA_ID=CAMNT_0043978721 /DNA_START=120 /DNA_END=830 /DNA_ORIENTATION=-
MTSNGDPQRVLPDAVTLGLGIGAMVLSIACMIRVGCKGRRNVQAMPAAIIDNNSSSIDLNHRKQLLEQGLITARITDCHPLDLKDIIKDAPAESKSIDSISREQEPTTFDDNVEMSQLTCYICLDRLSAGNLVAWSKINSECNHAFHKDCIMEWLLRHNDCPCCRECVVAEGFELVKERNAKINNDCDGNDIETGTVNEDGKNIFCATHGRACETCTAHEISSSTLEMSSDIEEWA